MKKTSSLVKLLIPAILIVAGFGRADEPINDDMAKRINTGYSFAPIVGYTPTYGLILGGAAFRGEGKPDISNGSLLLNASLQKNYDIEFYYTRWNRDRMYGVFNFVYTTFFDPYFGVGGNTNLAAKQQIEIQQVTAAPELWYRIDRQTSVGVTSQLKYRNETGVDGDPGARVFGTEFTPVVGAGIVYDGRDNQIDSHAGEYLRASIDVAPGFLSSRKNANSFVRLELEARKFVQLFPWLVLAGHSAAGFSYGSPSFPYRWTLGGSSRLRGYQNNRMLGDQYYLGQLEARFIALCWLSFVLYAGAGDMAASTFGDFRGPKFTKGFGIRIGLPPDFVAKARLDFGFSPDESNFYLNFNEAF